MLTMNKFNVGDTVLYRNGDRYEIGIVKKVITNVGKTILGAHHYFDGVIDYLENKPTLTAEQSACLDSVRNVLLTETFEEDFIYYTYRVWYHMGDTTALTDEHLLIPIANAYAFTVLRRTVDD